VDTRIREAQEDNLEHLIPSNTVLLIIDAQQGIDDPKWGQRNNPDAEANISRLINLWRRRKRPVVHIQHCSIEPDSPLRPELPGCRFKPEATPVEGESVFKKKVNSAFIGTELESYLKDNDIEHIVIVGFTTDHCVSTTTRMAANLGFKALLVSDATATFDRKGPDGEQYLAEEIHAINIASLNGEFCNVSTTASLISA
jgi:nicotinamidase-related amidase